ncbi:deoxyribonuclease IV, partial [Candidatus Thorarchaeota archaeon]
RLIKALRFAPLMNVERIVFHPGGYVGHTPEEAYRLIKQAIERVWERRPTRGQRTFLAPEIAGKKNAFGSPGEIIRLCSEVEGCIPTIDWAHLYARTRGDINDKDSYRRVLGIFEDALGDVFVKNMHFHVSGIEFTDAGEKSHKPLDSKWGPDILPLVELVEELGYDATFISETPEPIRGAVYAKYLLEELKK